MTGRRIGKLVRDRIPETIAAAGGIPAVRVLDDDEFLDALTDKLFEEAEEFRADRGLGELADVYQTVMSLADRFEGGRAELERIAAAKASARGGFEGRVFLESVRDQDS